MIALQDSNLRSGVVPGSGSVPSVGMGWVILDFGMAIPVGSFFFRLWQFVMLFRSFAVGSVFFASRGGEYDKVVCAGASFVAKVLSE
jgi:hypothetical protein